MRYRIVLLFMDYLVRHLIDNNLCTYNVSVMSILLPQFAVNIWQMWGESIYIYIYKEIVFKISVFVSYKNIMFAALFQTNHNIITDIITAYLQNRSKYTTPY